MLSNSPVTPPLRILVTGAAGLVGQALCGALAARGHAVAGLLRRKGPAAGNDAVSPSATDWLASGTVALFDGDVAEPGLGMVTSVQTRLAAELDLVIHCAAVTAFNLPAETYRRVNVGGTAQVLDFTAGPRPIALLHVSTAYVCGMVDGVVAEAPVMPGPFNNGYEASKAGGEDLVLAAHRAGRVAAIARPSVVVGRWADGATSSFGTIYQAIRLLAEGRLRVLPVAPDASLDLVPIDYVIDGLADIAERMAEANGCIFHLASGRPVPIAALRRLAAAFPQLHSPRLVLPEQFDLASLDKRERWLHEQVVAPCAAYLRPSPQFVTANLPVLSQRHCPPLDDAFLRRMIAFAVSAGFLPSERLSVYPDSGGPNHAADPPPN